MSRWQKLTLRRSWIAEISSPTSRTCRASNGKTFQTISKSRTKVAQDWIKSLEPWWSCSALLWSRLFCARCHQTQSRGFSGRLFLLLAGAVKSNIFKGTLLFPFPDLINEFLAYKTPSLNCSGLKNKSWKSLKRMLWLSFHLPYLLHPWLRPKQLTL